MCRNHRHGRQHGFYWKQIMQTTIIFLMHNAFYFKFIIIHMNRICDLQIKSISYFILCIASLRISYNGMSWNSRNTNADHTYLWRNRTYICIIHHWFDRPKDVILELYIVSSPQYLLVVWYNSLLSPVSSACVISHEYRMDWILLTTSGTHS